MKQIRIFFAVLVCKLSRAVIRLLGRGGTAFPGRMALKVCPDVLSALSKGVRTILITGTNGKTTSARMIEQAFIDQKRSYFSNKSGANLISDAQVCDEQLALRPMQEGICGDRVR